MARRRKTPPPANRAARPKPEPGVFASPFKDLKKLLHEHSTNPPVRPAASRIASPPPAAPASEPALYDAAMFLQAIDGVRRIGSERPARVIARPEVTLEIVSEEAEVLAQLSDLVSGVGKFELTET